MSSAELLVGVDVGTSRVKAIALDLDGIVRGEAERATPWTEDGGRTEIDPRLLADVACDAAGEAAARAGRGVEQVREPRVVGVGVTSMAETGVLVDSRERPLAAAIAWHDPRGDDGAIERALGAETFQAATGLPLTALPSLAKLLWLRRHAPETKAGARFFSVAEWIVRRLGGEPVSELSLASRTGLFDVRGHRPWDAAFELLDSPPLLVELAVAGTRAGTAGGDHAPAMLRGAALTVAGHDHQTASYGAGAAEDGALFDSLGTAEALVRTLRAPLAPDRISRLTAQNISVGWGVVPEHLCILAGIPTGLTLERIAALVGVSSVADRAALGEQALSASPGDSPLRLVSPRYEEFGLAGITDGASPALLWRAAVDGLGAEADRVLDHISRETGPHRRVVVAGGWLNNPAVLAAKRRQHPQMEICDIAEPGAYGAALMAAAAAGVPVPAPADASPAAPHPFAKRDDHGL